MMGVVLEGDDSYDVGNPYKLRVYVYDANTVVSDDIKTVKFETVEGVVKAYISVEDSDKKEMVI